MAVLLSLLAAVSYGLADFIGGTSAKRANAWSVALVAQAAGTVLVLVVALARGGDPTGADLGWGLLAGLGFGFLFVALAQIPDTAGLLPLAVNQAVAGVAIIAVAIALRQPWVPRERAALGGALAGSLGTLATVFFLLASQRGYLSVTAVLTSLYPAFTVILAASVLREHIHRAQAAGLLLCAVAVSLVAAG